MALRNRLVWIALVLRSADDMAPQHAYFVTSLHGDDLRGNGLLEVGVAGDVGISDILNRVV